MFRIRIIENDGVRAFWHQCDLGVLHIPVGFLRGLSPPTCFPVAVLVTVFGVVYDDSLVCHTSCVLYLLVCNVVSY